MSCVTRVVQGLSGQVNGIIYKFTHTDRYVGLTAEWCHCFHCTYMRFKCKFFVILTT